MCVLKSGQIHVILKIKSWYLVPAARQNWANQKRETKKKKNPKKLDQPLRPV